MRRALFGAAVATALLVPASDAGAYVIGGPAWRTHVITYYSALRDPTAVGMAAKAWNTSGAHVRFVKTSRARARLILNPGVGPQQDGGRCGGWADEFGDQKARAGILMNPACKGESLSLRAGVLAHEMGHILGLGHETRKCAVMTGLIWFRCAQPKPWQFRCHLIEPDDVRGAVRLYGGRARRRPGYCQQWAAPHAATGLEVSGARGTVISWVNPPEPRRTPGAPDKVYLAAQIYRAPGPCPRHFSYEARIDGDDAVAGQRQTHTLRADVAVATPGQWCYGLAVMDNFERGPQVMTTVTIVNQSPVASFTVQPDPASGPNCFAVQDSSSDPDGSVAGWTFDFGYPADPGARQEGDPSARYCYPQPGTYTITLTVTDNDGATGSTSRQVQASDQPAPASTGQ